MKKLLFIFSHIPTKEQLEDAKKSLGVTEFITLTDELKNIWSNIPEELQGSDIKFKEYILENCSKDDYILIEGHFGIVYKMVNWALKNGYKAIYSHSSREYKYEEKYDGSIKNIHYFKHKCYKMYEE